MLSSRISVLGPRTEFIAKFVISLDIIAYEWIPDEFPGMLSPRLEMAYSKCPRTTDLRQII